MQTDKQYKALKDATEGCASRLSDEIKKVSYSGCAAAQPIDQTRKQTGKAQWYVGARRNARYIVFQSRVEPQQDTHGAVFSFCFGPYMSEGKAITVARYQTHGAYPLYGYERGPGWQLLDCYKPVASQYVDGQGQTLTHLTQTKQSS